MPLIRRSSGGDDPITSSPSLKQGTKRRFPLLGRRKTKDAKLPPPLPTAASPSKSPSQTAKPGLRVHVLLKFEGSSASEHIREYEAFQKLKASGRLCQLLLSRLQHCSAELITRHDCNALVPLRKHHRDVKPLRYLITYRVERDGVTLMEKSLRSFQEYELSYDDTREVIAATDRIVGLFLVRHDPAFRWTDPSEADEAANSESETVRPCTGRPQQLVCVPRSRFIHESRKFELVPGYSIELFLRSRCATRYPENRNASIRIDSRQSSPLTLLLGEELTTRVSNLVIDPVDSCKRKFDKRHRTCAGLEGTNGCTHLEDGAVDIMVKVRNSIGPDYNYFSHRIQTSKVLFDDHQGRDFDELANQIKAKLEKARDMTDKSMRSLDDVTLRIRELRGHGWSVHEPLIARLNPTTTYCRQTIEALVERLQSGISNVLEHHEDSLAIMTIHKRGQLIYDGFLDGAGGSDSMPLEKFATPELEKKALEARLKERIRADITMVCKDTCALDNTDTLPNLRIKVSSASASSIGGSSTLPRSMGTSSSVVPSPARTVSASTSLPRPASESSIFESMTSSQSGHALSKKAGQQNLKESAQTPPSPSPAPATPTPDLRRVPSGVEKAKKHGYMADFMADDENQSEPPFTPSLVDTDSISPRDSVVATPQSTRGLPQDQSNEGLRIVDDGRRIIYQEQSDMDAIANGVTELHRNYDADDEPLQLVEDRLDHAFMKDNPPSLDTRMPDLSRTPSASIDNAKKEVVVSEDPKIERPTAPAQERAVTPVNPASADSLAVESQPSVPAADERKEGAPKPDVEEVVAERSQPVQCNTETESFEQDVGQWEMVDINEAHRTQGLPVKVEANQDVTQKKDESTILNKEPAVPESKVETKNELNKELVQAPAQETNEPATINYEAAEAETKLPEPGESVNSIINHFTQPPSVHPDANPEEKVGGVSERTTQGLVPENAVQKTQKESATECTKDPEKKPESVRESNGSSISVQPLGKEEVVAPKETTLQPQPEPSKEVVANEVEKKNEPHREEVSFTLAAKPSAEDATAPASDDTVPGPIIEQISSVLETVPEDTAPEPAVVVAKDTHVTSTENTTAETATHSSQKTPTPLLPVTASAPLEMFPMRDDFFNLAPAPEKEADSPEFETKSLPRPLARPRTNTLPERRFSTALTLDLSMGPFDPDDDSSPTGEPSKSASGIYRRHPLHRRQPSAGFVGLQEQRLNRIGLRNALVPYRWQTLREDGVWEGRSSTSHSER